MTTTAADVLPGDIIRKNGQQTTILVIRHPLHRRTVEFESTTGPFTVLAMIPTDIHQRHLIKCVHGEPTKLGKVGA